MKKHIIGLALIITLISGGASIEVLDTTVKPDTPRYNDSVNVTTYIDGEGLAINSVDVDVRQNGELIVTNAPMNHISGDERSISSWKLVDAFTVVENSSEDVNYDLTVQAIDTQGNNDIGILGFTVLDNQTVVEEPTNPQDSNIFYGFTIADIFVMGALALFIIVLFTED